MTDNWDSYLCEVEGRPASILVDLGAVSLAPMPEYPCLGYVTVALREPDRNGFPRREEFNVLSALEDGLEAALTADGAAVHIGRCVTDGRYELVFYAATGGDWRSRVAGAMNKLPSFDWEASAHYEPNWDTYLGFLFPGEQDLLTIQNRRLLRRLREEGDSPKTPRPICHWLEFLDSGTGENFCRAALEQGFRVEEAGLVFEPEGAARVFPASAPFPDSPAGLLPAATRPTFFQARVIRTDAPEDIDNVSFALLELALEYGGAYRGWACSVVS